MLIWGGAMAGYCDTGRPRIESAPASITRMPTTHAKIGRSMKNCATGAPLRPFGFPALGADRSALPRRLLRSGGRGHRLHLDAGPDLLQPLDDDLLAALEARGDEPGV